MKGSADTLCDTTSEPPVGNGRSGAPVNASMSGSASCNQGGTVEYKNDLYPTPDSVQGVGIFYAFLPNQKGGNYHERRKSVHL